MSQYLLLNNWMGADMEHATEKMATVFRMEMDEAEPIMDHLAGGNPWQFDYQVSDQQSEVAKGYLEELGFEVETIPAVMSGSGGEVGESAMPDDGASAPAKPGLGEQVKDLMDKIKGAFAKFGKKKG